MEPVWDVAIVGAGPAGASAALSALHVRPDARVLLLDRSNFPRDKACGDGIAPHALDVLASVGVYGIERGYAGVERLQIGFASGPVANGVMARPAYVIPREVFDARLVEAALDRGAELRQHRVRTAAVTDDGRYVDLDGTIRARVVIAADGASSVIRRQLAPPRARASHTAVAIRGYAPVTAGGAGRQEIVFASPNGRGRANWPAYAWSFPIGDGRANVGYGELLGPGQPLTRQHLLDRLEDLLPGAAEGGQSWRAHLLPLSTGRPRQPEGRILFAGDAMNLINPVTGEGIFYAVASGMLAGRAAVTSGKAAGRAAVASLALAGRVAVSSRGMAGAASVEAGDSGCAYRAAMQRALGVHLRHTDAASLLARSPAIVGAAVRAANRDSATFDDLVELGLGAGRLTPSALRGIAAALLRARTRS